MIADTLKTLMAECEDLQALRAQADSDPAVAPWRLGQAYLIRLVTHYWTGRLVSVTQHEIVITEAAWIPDTGRYSTCVTSGTPTEVEPVDGRVILGRGAVVDAVEIATLPRTLK